MLQDKHAHCLYHKPLSLLLNVKGDAYKWFVSDLLLDCASVDVVLATKESCTWRLLRQL